jgi:hypothetical protein
VAAVPPAVVITQQAQLPAQIGNLSANSWQPVREDRRTAIFESPELVSISDCAERLCE